MTTPVDPMPGLRAIIKASVPAIADDHVVIGPALGELSPPFVVIRSTGGPEEEAQVPEAERRIDVNVFAKDPQEANRLSNLIHAHIRRRPPGGTIQLPNIFSAGGPLDFQDEDRRIPAVFRSYYVIYGEAT